VLRGFVDLDHPELMAPFQDAYFAALPALWGNWSSAMAQDFVEGGYMALPLAAGTVAATDAYIATSNPPAALLRLLNEGRDDVLRALRCQARDHSAS